MDSTAQQVASVGTAILIILTSGEEYLGKFLDHNFPFAKFSKYPISNENREEIIYVNLDHITSISIAQTKDGD